MVQSRTRLLPQRDDADYGWRILCCRGLSLQQGGQFEQLLYGGFASLMCSGMLRALEGFVQHGRADQRGRFLDGDDEPGQLGRQRDSSCVRSDPACRNGLAHGRRGLGDLSGSTWIRSSWLQSPR